MKKIRRETDFDLDEFEIPELNLDLDLETRLPTEGIPYEREIEKDCKLELSKLQTDFRQRAKQEAARQRLATDSEYWVCLCFMSRQQKEEFLSKLDLLDLGDKYLDGRKVAKRLNIKLEAIHYRPQEEKSNKSMTNFLMEENHERQTKR